MGNRRRVWPGRLYGPKQETKTSIGTGKSVSIHYLYFSIAILVLTCSLLQFQNAPTVIDPETTVHVIPQFFRETPSRAGFPAQLSRSNPNQHSRARRSRHFKPLQRATEHVPRYPHTRIQDWVWVFTLCRDAKYLLSIRRRKYSASGCLEGGDSPESASWMRLWCSLVYLSSLDPGDM